VISTKTLVLGLDGIDNNFWKSIDAFSLVDYCDELETYMSTLPSWMCSLTGREFTERRSHSFVSHRVYGYKMLWDYLKDIKQIYLNIPVTKPAEKVNGVMVCGDWRNDKMDSTTIYPPELIDGLEALGYVLTDSFQEKLEARDWDGFLEEALRLFSLRTKAIKHLADIIQPEFIFAVYRVSDECLHQRGETRLGEKRIQKMEKALALELQEVIDTLQPETTLFFSDHSITPEGYHGADHPETVWGTWGLKTELDHIPPIDRAHILDIFPTILTSLDIDVPKLKGSSLVASSSDRKSFETKLRRLGYIA